MKLHEVEYPTNYWNKTNIMESFNHITLLPDQIAFLQEWDDDILPLLHEGLDLTIKEHKRLDEAPKPVTIENMDTIESLVDIMLQLKVLSDEGYDINSVKPKKQPKDITSKDVINKARKGINKAMLKATARQFANKIGDGTLNVAIEDKTKERLTLKIKELSNSIKKQLTTDNDEIEQISSSIQQQITKFVTKYNNDNTILFAVTYLSSIAAIIAGNGVSKVTSINDKESVQSIKKASNLANKSVNKFKDNPKALMTYVEQLLIIGNNLSIDKMMKKASEKNMKDLDKKAGKTPNNKIDRDINNIEDLKFGS